MKKYQMFTKLSSVREFVEEIELLRKLKTYIFIEETSPVDQLTDDNVYVLIDEVKDMMCDSDIRNMQAEFISYLIEERWTAKVEYSII